MDPRVYQELQGAKSIKDIFDTLNKYYDLSAAKPSPFIKGVILGYMDRALSSVNAKPRPNV